MYAYPPVRTCIHAYTVHVLLHRYQCYISVYNYRNVSTWKLLLCFDIYIRYTIRWAFTDPERGDACAADITKYHKHFSVFFASFLMLRVSLSRGRERGERWRGKGEREGGNRPYWGQGRETIISAVAAAVRLVHLMMRLSDSPGPLISILKMRRRGERRRTPPWDYTVMIWWMSLIHRSPIITVPGLVTPLLQSVVTFDGQYRLYKV